LASSTIPIIHSADFLSARATQSVSLQWTGSLTSARLVGSVAVDVVGIGDVESSVKVNNVQVANGTDTPLAQFGTHAVKTVNVDVSSYVQQGQNSFEVDWNSAIGTEGIVKMNSDLDLTLSATGSVSGSGGQGGGGTNSFTEWLNNLWSSIFGTAATSTETLLIEVIFIGIILLAIVWMISRR
jgi:hypothetical protein